MANFVLGIKLVGPAEIFTDLVIKMSTVNQQYSFISRTDVLLEKFKKICCLFYPSTKMAETLSTSLTV